MRVLVGAGYWGPSVSPWGLVARRSSAPRGAEGGLAEIVVVPALAPRPSRSTGALWDPLVAWTPAGALVLAERAGAGDDPRALVSLGGATPRTATRWFADLGVPSDDPADVVDLAITPTDHGAVVAWIAGDPGVDVARRRLALARIGCRVDEASAPGQRIGSQRP